MIKSKIIKTLIQLLKKLNTNTIFIETKNMITLKQMDKQIN